MKQKAELFKPIIYALLAALAAVDVLCFFTDITLFYFVIALSVVTIGFCLVRLIFIQREIEAFVLGMGERIGSMQRDSVIYLPMPVLVTDAGGEVVWYNDACRRQVFREIDHYGSSIQTLLPQIQLPGLLREGSADIAIDTREYTVYGVEDPGTAGPMYTLYMIDNTELKRYYREYFYTRAGRDAHRHRQLRETAAER
jgi:c-di-AMP phosphodiesterase-like protein